MANGWFTDTVNQKSTHEWTVRRKFVFILSIKRAQWKWCTQNVNWNVSDWATLSSRMSRIFASNQRVGKGVMLLREKGTCNQPEDIHHRTFRGGSIGHSEVEASWCEQGFRSDITPTCTTLDWGPVTAVRYRDNLDPTVGLYAAAVGPTFDEVPKEEYVPICHQQEKLNIAISIYILLWQGFIQCFIAVYKIKKWKINWQLKNKNPKMSILLYAFASNRISYVLLFFFNKQKGIRKFKICHMINKKIRHFQLNA